jgi:hypothetical protein
MYEGEHCSQGDLDFLFGRRFAATLDSPLHRPQRRTKIAQDGALFFGRGLQHPLCHETVNQLKVPVHHGG